MSPKTDSVLNSDDLPPIRANLGSAKLKRFVVLPFLKTRQLSRDWFEAR
jgi:hypothetical protein